MLEMHLHFVSTAASSRILLSIPLGLSRDKIW